MLDSHSGTHLVPPSYALPDEGFDNKTYAPEVQEWLAEYEKTYGRRGTSDVTTEKVPIAQTCGPARVIDVAAPRSARRPASVAGLAGDHVPPTSKRTRSARRAAAGRRRHFPQRLERPLLSGRCPWARRAWKTR